MFFHHFDQMTQGSKVFGIALWGVLNKWQWVSGWISQSLSQWVTRESIELLGWVDSGIRAPIYLYNICEIVFIIRMGILLYEWMNGNIIIRMGILQVPKRLGLKLEPNIARIANALKCFKKVTKVFAKFWGKIVRLSSEIVFNVNCQEKNKSGSAFT